jgi:hypothetical protein
MFWTANILSASKVSLYFYRVSNSTNTFALAGPPLSVDLRGQEARSEQAVNRPPEHRSKQ